MMKKLFLVALAAMFTLSSCVKEEGLGGKDPGDGVEAKLKLSITGTKAVHGDQGKDLHNINVIVLNSTYGITHWHYTDIDALQTAGKNLSDVEYSVTTAAKHIVILGNYGDLTAKFNNTTMTPFTLATLQTKLIEYNLLSDAENSVWMYGTTASEISFTAVPAPTPENPEAKRNESSASVEVSVVPTRIDVSVTNNMKNRDHAKALMIKGVGVWYSAGFTHYVPATNGFIPATSALETGAKYYLSAHLFGWADQLSEVNHGTHANLKKTWEPTATNSWVPFAESFYALPAGAASPAFGKNLIVVVWGQFPDPVDEYGQPIDDGQGGTVKGEYSFFPVHFSTREKDMMYIQNGHWYELNINLTCDATTGGTDKPEEPLEEGFLELSITPKGWIKVNTITKEF